VPKESSGFHKGRRNRLSKEKKKKKLKKEARFFHIYGRRPEGKREKKDHVDAPSLSSTRMRGKERKN